MFHTHLFTPSEKDSEILYCRCGATKDIHRHQWVEFGDIFRTDAMSGTQVVKGKGLKCSVCGDIKFIRLDD